MGQREQASSPINLDALRLIRDGFADSGMTQVALARACGIPRSSLANILSPSADHRLIHVAQLVKIAIALDVDARDWIGQLEALERRRQGRGVDLGRQRGRSREAPQVQKRAARRRTDAPTSDEE